MIIVVFLRRRNRPTLFAAIPAIVMLAMPLAALVLLAKSFGLGSVIGVSSLVMLLLGVVVAAMAVRLVFVNGKEPQVKSKAENVTQETVGR